MNTPCDKSNPHMCDVDKQTAAETEHKAEFGRTYADAIVDVAKMLDPKLPAILFGVGVVIGLIQFRQSMTEAQQKAWQQYQADLNAVNKSMREACAESANLNKQVGDRTPSLKMQKCEL